LRNFAYYTLYFSLPGAPLNVVPWGQADIAETVVSYQNRTHIPNIIALYSGSDEAKYVDYWQRSYVNQYSATVMQSGSGYRITPLQLIYNTEAGVAVDWRPVLPTQRAFNTVDSETKRPISGWISRTGWDSAADSLVFASAYDINYTTDHMGTGNPGSYKIWKNGWLLNENGSSGDKDTGVGINSNMIVFGGAANLKTPAQWQDPDMSITDGDPAPASAWAYARIDLVGAYTPAATASRALRHIAHFKKPDTQDYLIVYDDVASKAGTTKEIRLHYDRTAGESSGLTTTTLPDIVWTGPNRRLSTRIVLPATAAMSSEVPSPNNSQRQKICMSADGSTCDALNESAEFLLVHRPSASTLDVMPATELLASSSNFRALQMADDTAPKVAVFPRRGRSYSEASFTSTHSGKAQILVLGLTPGTYKVSGPVTLAGQVVGTSGALYLEGEAGAYVIARMLAPPAITKATVPSGIMGVEYSYTLTATGDTPSWSVASGTLPAWATLDASTGAITGTPNADGIANFTVRAANASASDEKALTLIVLPTNSVAQGISMQGVAIR
jgi:hypothetical protein